MPDAAFFWNDVLLHAALTDSKKQRANQEQEGPTRTSRAAAIVHAALHDAVNSVERRNSPYLVQDRAPAGSLPEAAAAGSAHAALSDLYPSQAATFDQKLAEFRATLPSGPNLVPSVQFGAMVAGKLLADRTNDGATPEPVYVPNPKPARGKWRPDPVLAPPGTPLTPHWGSVRPFTLPSGDALRPPPPPALTSGDYTFQFRNVYVKGSDPSPPATPPPLPNVPRRTADETEIGKWWSYDRMRGTPIRLYNQHARQILDQEPNPPAVASVLHRHARILALINLAMADAGIACWESKFAYNYWRPFQGIRLAADDGNPDTVPNPNWLPLGQPQVTGIPGNQMKNTTPNFPAYVSGHSSFGAAMFGMLRKFFDGKVFRCANTDCFELLSEEVPGTKRRYMDMTLSGGRIRDKFQQAIDENSESRVFLGVHWRRDITMGTPLGQMVANHVWDNYLRPVP
jgi:hypothetical protein